MIEEYECFTANKGRPVTEWEFPLYDAEYYVSQFSEDSFCNDASANALQLCRKLTGELLSDAGRF